MSEELTQQAAMAGNSAWMLMSAALVLLMTPAVAFFYGGMGRSKGMLNMLMMSFGSMGVIGVVYMLWGWSMSYGETSIGGVFASPFDHFGLSGMLTDADGNYIIGAAGYPAIIDVAFQVTFAIITVALVSGAVAERVRFGTWLIFAALWGTLSYFPMAHMVWGGGLLSHSENSLAAWIFGTVTEGGETVAAVAPIDFAGGTVVHINAGIAALVLVALLGNRSDFNAKAPFRPHNLPFVMLGSGLLWFGWFGFNGGSAFAADGLAGLAWVNTTAATCAAMLGWLLVERIRDGRYTSLGAASGVVAGLVTITPAAGALTPVTSIIAGLIGGALCALAIGLKMKFNRDDSMDVVGVHLTAGLWGTIVIGLLAEEGGLFFGGGFSLLAVQVLIAVVAMIYCALVTALCFFILKPIGWRIPDDAEDGGIDHFAHGESAYDDATDLVVEKVSTSASQPATPSA